MSISFLLEYMPQLDALDQAREMIRRIESWLIIQDKAIEGYATPFDQHLHPSMERYSELYLMATRCPWGYSDCYIPCKFSNWRIYRNSENILDRERAPTPLEWVDTLSDWRWLSESNKVYAINPNWYHYNGPIPRKFKDAIIDNEFDRASCVQSLLASRLADNKNNHPMKRYDAIHVSPMPLKEVGHWLT